MSSPSPEPDKAVDENLAAISASTEEPNHVDTKPSPKSMPTTAKNGSSTGPISAPKKPTVLQRAWKKVDFNPTTVMIMVKPAIAATIAMAIFQSHAFAKHYLNLGYLIIIVSITTVPILPRGKFIMNLLVSVVSERLPLPQCTYIHSAPLPSY